MDQKRLQKILINENGVLQTGYMIYRTAVNGTERICMLTVCNIFLTGYSDVFSAEPDLFCCKTKNLFSFLKMHIFSAFFLFQGEDQHDADSE